MCLVCWGSPAERQIHQSLDICQAAAAILCKTYLLHLFLLNYHISFCQDVKSATASRIFQATAPKLWNNLPSFIKSSCSYNVFKRRLKSYLFAQVFT